MKELFKDAFLSRPLHSVFLGLVVILFLALNYGGYAIGSSLDVERVKGTGSNSRSHFYHK